MSTRPLLAPQSHPQFSPLCPNGYPNSQTSRPHLTWHENQRIVKKELGSGGDAPGEPTSLMNGEKFSYNELKNIGTKIKEVFQKMESAFNDALSPEHGKKGSLEEDEELVPSGETYGDAPSSDDSEELVPSSGDGDALSIED
ncbi:hypothetical protein V6N13_110031 [Hibiscus sabdariffa]